MAYEKESFLPAEMTKRSLEFYKWMDKRRTVRDFSDKPVPKETIENILMAASTAPSGAHKQPWTFCVVKDPGLKKLQTDWQKEFLETAPWLIIVFKKSYELNSDGSKGNVYYASESCGLACGFLLTAIHHAGLVALTHTPSPMNFLSKLLNRPENEKPFLLIPVGYPADECWVPVLKRKELNEMSVWL